jgi:hypothetical protein
VLLATSISSCHQEGAEIAGLDLEGSANTERAERGKAFISFYNRYNPWSIYI